MKLGPVTAVVLREFAECFLNRHGVNSTELEAWMDFRTYLVQPENRAKVYDGDSNLPECLQSLDSRPRSLALGATCV